MPNVQISRREYNSISSIFFKTKQNKTLDPLKTCTLYSIYICLFYFYFFKRPSKTIALPIIFLFYTCFLFIKTLAYCISLTEACHSSYMLLLAQSFYM